MHGNHPHRAARLVAIIALGLTAPAGAATTTFRVQVPAATPPADIVYIAGDFQGWNPGDPAYALTRQAGGEWTITLNLPDGAPIQFKFTRGTWAKVEKGPSGEEISNRTHTPAGTQTLNLVVANWADLAPSTIAGHVESFTFAPFLGGRRCWVYLPPDYFTSTDPYPVLYMHDGQNIFDQFTSFAGEWKVDEACEELIGDCTIEPIIVVGIENGPNRCNEYTPWPDGSLPCAGGGAAYLNAIRDVLIPEVNQRYRTRTGPANTYLAGSSLGGIISAYAAYAYAEVFGRVAAVSPSYWAQPQMFPFATAQGRPADLTHFYQDMGTQEGGFPDANGNGVNDHVDRLRNMRNIAVSQGFVEGEDLLSVEAAGHTHSEFYWSQRFPNILRFLIDPPAPSGDANCDGAVDLLDHAAWVDCCTGPGGAFADHDCAVFDFDDDGDVDLQDHAGLLQRFAAP